MKSELVLDAHILDIIFENRNKAYGAYALRKFYNNRLLTSMGFIFLFAAIVMVCLFLFAKPGKTITVLYSIPSGHELHEIRPLMEKPKLPQKPASPKIPSIKPAAATQAFVSQVRFVDNQATRLASNLDSLLISNMSNIVSSGGNGGPVTGNARAADNVKPDSNKITDRKIPVSYAEVPPSYPGGEDALLRFLQRNLQNPADLDNGQVVSVKIKFVVGYDGQLRGFEVTEDGGRVFNNEVIRVLKKMPAWNPGKNAGEDVSVYYSLPVKFMAQD